ncbi:natural killer cells antigen CD94-like isoform X2 [Biomphalaria glabrata]|uniref:Natural killer cells antigen CD94-like isoform X2 n=1 Tax=Biomphalaria glabrata TaxID=6526 RepID=A0A9W3AIA1_BIOGL|nr:natural killer cells antigen CD94-like isoform X2 [Biomphalaria glabrata]
MKFNHLYKFIYQLTGYCPTEKDVISQGKCYTLFEAKITWPEAKAACESFFMSLAEFENKEEASLVVQNLVEPSWIGIYDLANEHTTYAWLSNNKVANIDYWSTSPTYDANMCVIIKWENGSFADTIHCDEQHFYICMSPMQNNSESTTEISSITTATTTETPSITTSTTVTPSITTTSTTVRAFNTAPGTETATFKQTTPVCQCSASMKLEANLSVLIGLVFLVSI